MISGPRKKKKNDLACTFKLQAVNRLNETVQRAITFMSFRLTKTYSRTSETRSLSGEESQRVNTFCLVLLRNCFRTTVGRFATKLTFAVTLGEQSASVQVVDRSSDFATGLISWPRRQY